MPLSHAMSEHGMVGGAVAVKSATLASELEQPDKTEPTEAIPKAEEGPARCPAVRFRFLLYPFLSRSIFISAQPEEAALASIHAKQPARINESNHRRRHHSDIA